MPKTWTTLTAAAASAALWAGPLAHAATVTGYWSPGQSGAMVRLLQTDLDHLGYHIAPTGYFGPVTEAAVKTFQAKHGLATDGIVGPETESALNRSLNATAAPSSSPTATRYTVQAGNTLGGIASRFHTSVATLAALNHLANPNWLQIGQVLLLPAQGSPAAAASAAVRSSNPAGAGRYVVRPGDTLSQIAARFGIAWPTLAAVNHLANPNWLHVGQVLMIPGSPASAPSIPAKQAGSGSASVSLPANAPSQTFGAAIAATARRYLGDPYVWGGASPAGFDCSGLVQYVFAQNGVSLPRTSWAQFAAVTKIPRSALQPGDLVFFSTYGAGASHVGIYIGADPAQGYSQAFIDAPAPGQRVMIMNFNAPYWQSHFVGAGRVNP
ncbi:MAG: LysM peptidoglycan-binding domain-containing protein [Thermaerobacter sp.]|nr:LysM peptidoglycan-binding domain-containing protein [Thermaerobacter sp.]